MPPGATHLMSSVDVEDSCRRLSARWSERVLGEREQSACSLPLADAMDQRRTPCHIDGAIGFQRSNELTERDASASGGRERDAHPRRV